MLESCFAKGMSFTRCWRHKISFDSGFHEKIPKVEAGQGDPLLSTTNGKDLMTHDVTEEEAQLLEEYEVDDYDHSVKKRKIYEQG